MSVSMSTFPFRNSGLSIEKRVDDLVGRLTLKEKISQMVYDAPAVERLGIPAYNWWNECLHGVARAGWATVFPQAIGLAATFDEDLVYRVAAAVSDEARAKYHQAQKKREQGQYQGLTFWTPNINIFRDPRWGRGQETYGEDPYLTGALGSSFVKGLQGSDPRYLKVAACAKHFAVHSGPEKDRHRFNAVVTQKDLHETYLRAFKMLVDAGVEAIMGAYNRTNGEPCCASGALLCDILRRTWGFKGHMVSDCGAIGDIHAYHKVTQTPAESAALALKKGCDLNCGCMYPFLEEAVEQGMIFEEDIDRSLKRLFAARMKLGMFDAEDESPYSSLSLDCVDSTVHRSLAREAAVKSIVLLKNNNSILPLKSDVKRIFVTGPGAADVNVIMGNYHGISYPMVTILDGIVARAGKETLVNYRQGCTFSREDTNKSPWALGEATHADVIIVVAGLSPLMEGEEGDAILSEDNGDRISIGLPENQKNLIQELRKHNKPIVLLITGGSAVEIREESEIADAILYCWYPGEEGGSAVAEILFGDTSPSGRLPITIPRSIEQLPPFDSYDMANRTYRYMTDKPLYPFGFGLSYSSFSYSKLKINPEASDGSCPITVFVTVENEGEFDAEEVVQLYISPPETVSGAPIRHCEGFRRVKLFPGESQRVEFILNFEHLCSFDQNGTPFCASGEYTFTVGHWWGGRESFGGLCKKFIVP
ncbi:MAG: glycoside hydrolase family 3 protein [Chitinivibrionales bacterium]|nr:glycoside hydrolase family 3 protein [Chitinivibrionales bacterium]